MRKIVTLSLLALLCFGSISCNTTSSLERKGFSHSEIALIQEKKLVVGMRQEAVRQMYRSPNRASYNSYGSELWVYEPYHIFAKTDNHYLYIFFRNGVVEDWSIY